jgi:hypothetical protein
MPTPSKLSSQTEISVGVPIFSCAKAEEVAAKSRESNSFFIVISWISNAILQKMFIQNKNPA